MKVSFYIREPSASGQCSIFLRCIFFGSPIKVYIKETVKKSDWNSKTQRHKKDQFLNDYLEDIGYKVKQIYRSLVFNNTIDHFVFKIEVSKLFNTGTKLELVDTIRNWIENYKKNTIYQQSSSKKYTTLLHRMELYIEDHSNINSHFFKSQPNITKYVNHLYSIGLNPNTVRRELRNVAHLLKEFKIDYNVEFFNKIIKSIKKSKTYRPYLTEDEIQLLWNSKPKGYLLNVKYLFLRGIYSGLRISDWSKIDRTHTEAIKGTTYLTVFTQKTNKKVYVPLTPELDKLLSIEVRDISDVKFNKYVKELGKLAGINSNFIDYVFKDGSWSEKIVSKYTKLSSHVARYTWATNNYLNGVPLFKIRDVLGHSSDATTEGYIKRCLGDGY